MRPTSIIKNENAVDGRGKNYLTEAEIETFLKAARKGRHGVRNFAMMLLAYRHGLRVSELVDARLSDADRDTGRLFVHPYTTSISMIFPFVAFAGLMFR